MTDCDDARIHAYGVTIEAVGRLNQLFDRHLRSTCGLPQTSFEALLRMERSGGSMTMGELAAQTVLTGGGVTRLVDRLVADGYAERQDCPTDRRVQYAAITDAGRRVLVDALEVHVADIAQEFTERMSDAELSVVTEVMDRLRRPALEDAHS